MIWSSSFWGFVPSLIIGEGIFSKWIEAIDGNSQLSKGWDFGEFSVDQWGQVNFRSSLIFRYQVFNHSEWNMWLHSFVMLICESGSYCSSQITQLSCLYFGSQCLNNQEFILLKVSSTCSGFGGTYFLWSKYLLSILLK